ncbi:NAD-dependent epimerase/dehydratase family protein [Caloramator sp. CAR-1]|uniref:NAD-dependent epimerase/dehydratase family protein n=1 Tax=Caloramator sp. CAR-1 TaxID=3062777 RepID=UPI0026E3207C|nr:NAD-dependent epimerase/dehydratase family protein [Caloramator sp. CAR-1]MDO6355947.1 NAD-dependent epimerase/dehydratase family protein [Caloramator sp. CAR-1]
MKVLVTGGAGFIGSHIVDKLIEKGYETIIVDNLSTGKEENINKKAKFYLCDITDKNTLNEIFKTEKPEFVIHHAAQIDVQKSIKIPAFDAFVNIIGTVNILECCRDYNVKKIVYASSAAVYGNPTTLPIEIEHKTNPISFYGISKYTPEFYIKTFSDLFGFKYTILRYSNVYGIRQDPKGEGGVISIFIDRLIKSQPLIVYGDGEQTRDFIYVEDVAEANIKALTNGDNKTLNVSTNTSISLNKLIETMFKVAKKQVEVIYKEERKGDIKHSKLSNVLTKKILNWNYNHSIEEGIYKTYYHYSNLGM